MVQLFVDETDFGTGDFFFIVGLCCSENVIEQWKPKYLDLKKQLSDAGIILGTPPYHLYEIKKKGRGSFEPLRDKEKRNAFWTVLTDFVREMPFLLTAALVYTHEVRRAYSPSSGSRAKVMGLSALIENVAVMGPSVGTGQIGITHDWVDDHFYRTHLGTLLSRGDLRLLPVHLIKDLFNPNITWCPKNSQEMGVELADMIVNPVGRVLLSQTDESVPVEFVDEALKHFGAPNPCRTYRPYAVRLLP